MKTARKPKHTTSRKQVGDPKGERKFLIVGSKSWNKCYLEYEWNGHVFGKKRKQLVSDFRNTVEKRQEVRRNKFFTIFYRKVAEGRLSDVVQSSLGYTFTNNHTVNGDMYKEWMNEKRTKKDFRFKNNDERRIWVCLPDGQSEEEVEPINLMFVESDESNEVVKKSIINSMRDYPQCFITIMANNLMWTHAEEPKILNLTDDRLGHLRLIHKDHIGNWLNKYLK